MRAAPSAASGGTASSALAAGAQPGTIETVFFFRDRLTNALPRLENGSEGSQKSPVGGGYKRL